MKVFSSTNRRRFSFVFVAFLMYIIITTRSGILENTVLREVLSFSGLLLVASSIMGRLYSIIFIGGRKTRKLVIEGIYARTRNPLYFFSSLGVVGFALASNNLLFMLAIAIGFIFYYWGVIRTEEKVLSKKFPEEFNSYISKVNRFFPRKSIDVKTENIVPANLKTFRQTVFDSIWFFVGYGVIRLIDILHRSDFFGAKEIW